LKPVHKISTRSGKNIQISHPIFVVCASVVFKKFMEIYLLKAPLVNFQMNPLNTKNIFNVSRQRGEERLSLNSISEQLGVFVCRKC